MQKKLSRRFLLPLVVAAFGVFVVACGGGDDEPTATATSRPADPTATTAAPTATTPALAGDAGRGGELFVSETCAGCHSTGDNSIVGPGLKGVSARAATQGGDAFLIESLKNPNAVVADGFAPIMSSFAHLDDQAIADLVAYLNTLN